MKVESILPHNQVILTVGLAMVLSNLATVFFTGNYRSTPVSYASSAWYLTDYWKKLADRALPLHALVPFLSQRFYNHGRTLVLSDED